MSRKTKLTALVVILTGLILSGKKSFAEVVQHGKASFYWQRQRLASGGWYNPEAMTVAHKTLPFGTRVRIINLKNGKKTEAVVNDRGPYIRGRIVDASRAVARKLGMIQAGVVPVKLEVVKKSSVANVKTKKHKANEERISSLYDLSGQRISSFYALNYIDVDKRNRLKQ